MAIIPKRNLIEEAVERGEVPQEHRPYMGCSGLGSACQRSIWLGYRWVHERSVPMRVNRIFERGNLEEDRVVKDLNNAGMIVSDRQLFVTDETGHIRGHVDGIVKNVPGDENTSYLLEIKTMNSNRFKKHKQEPLDLTDPTYWVQIHVYMGFAGLTKCLFIATNKDNEERSYTVYDYDSSVFERYKAAGHFLLQSEFPPPKIGNHLYITCKFCGSYDYCHKNQPTSLNCRTCEHSEIMMNGEWRCNKTQNILSVKEQLRGCDLYEKKEGLK